MNAFSGLDPEVELRVSTTPVTVADAIQRDVDRKHWTDHVIEAKRAAIELHGEHWYRNPAAAVRVTLRPTAARHAYISFFGTKVVRRIRKDQVLPAREFWPHDPVTNACTFPAVLCQEPVRASDPTSMASIMAGRWGYPGGEWEWLNLYENGRYPSVVSCGHPQFELLEKPA